MDILLNINYMWLRQKIGKWLSPLIKDKWVTYSNSSLESWKERKYATELIPVKSY